MRGLEQELTQPESWRSRTRLRRWGDRLLRFVGIRSPELEGEDSPVVLTEPIPENNDRENSQPEIEKTSEYLFFETLLRPETIYHELEERERKLATLTDPAEIARQEAAIETMKTFPDKRLVIDRSDPRAQQIRQRLMRSLHDDHQPKLEYGTWAPYRPSDVQPHILIGDSEEPFDIPLTNVVGASSFGSWEGRGYLGNGDKEIYENGATLKMSSADVVRRYAERESAIPPIDYVIAFVQPNGLIFYVVDGGSHRTGAAIKRGEQSIKTKNIKIDLMPFNYFENEELRR